MSKQNFIDWVEMIFKNEHYGKDIPFLAGDASEFYEALKVDNTPEKKILTDNGKIILQFLQNNTDRDMWKSKDIADGLGISSRSVSGAMRKLCDENFVEALGSNPKVYKITDKGNKFDLSTI